MINLRPHHLLCILFFEGKGYNKEFTLNMQNIINNLSHNTKIKLTLCTDEICKKCPNNKNNICLDNKKVSIFDKKVLSLCEINNIEYEFDYKDLTNKVLDKIIFPGKRKDICGLCVWNEICENKYYIKNT